MQCPNCHVSLSLSFADAKVAPASSGPGFPLLKYDHRFTSQAELDDYERRVRERDANLDGSDAQNQATVQPWQKDIKALTRAELEDVLADLGRNHKEQEVFRTYGPTALIHSLADFMKASGIADIGYMSGDHSLDGIVVPPTNWPELGDMTVARAKELAGM